MIAYRPPALDLSKPAQVIFLFLLGLWSASQLLSVLGFLPDGLLAILHHSKNMLGAAVIAWSLLVILSQFLQHRVIPFDKNLFFLATLISVLCNYD